MIIKMQTSDTSFQKKIKKKLFIFVSLSSTVSHSKESEQNRIQVLPFGSPEQADAIQLIVLSLTFPMASRALFGSFSFNITFIATECFKVTSYRVIVLATKLSWPRLGGKSTKDIAGQSACASRQWSA